MRASVFKGNLIVSNLPSQFTSSDLAELFDVYGLVLGAKVERWHDRPGGAQGLVDLAPATSVDKAIEVLNGHSLAGNKLVVKRAPVRTKPASRAPASAGQRSRLAEAPHARLPMMEQATASQRKVVVEYRAPTRRITIPPRTRTADHG